jgi:hypothetical protein
MKCHPSVFSYLGVKNSLKFSYKAKAPTLTLSAGKEETSTSGRSEVPQVKPDLGDPAQTVVWGGRLPSRRRAITGGLTGLAIGESLRLAAPASVVNLQSIIGISRGREVAATCPAVQLCSRAQHSTLHGVGPYGCSHCNLQQVDAERSHFSMLHGSQRQLLNLPLHPCIL